MVGLRTLYTYSDEVEPDLPKRKRTRTKYYERYVPSSDTHCFVGRIFDLRMVAYHYDSYEALSKHKDCKYAFDIITSLSNLTKRVESLNLVGDLIWLNQLTPANIPVSAYEWLIIAADVFLMRYVSVVDCALILTNDVFEVGLRKQNCNIKELTQKGVTEKTIRILKKMLSDQGHLRIERNSRIHHGEERCYTQDDTTFRTAALFTHSYNGISGTDRFGHKINLDGFFKEGLVELQKEFNKATKKLVRQLDLLYNELGIRFETSFVDNYGGPPPRCPVRYSPKHCKATR